VRYCSPASAGRRNSNTGRTCRNLVTTDYLGSERDGGFAEFVTVPASNAHVVGGVLRDVELATFPTAYATAMRMLNRAAVERGETVLVTGALGGVGSALIQLATIRGARVVAVVGAAKRVQARELGAEATIDRDDLATALSEHAVDVVADVVAGPLVETDLRTVYLKQLQLIGSSFGSHEDFAQLLAHITTGELKPLLAATYPLRELRAAQEHFAKKNFFGKLVVTPGE
jgi:NADPH:quinone reductase-like Zn-dependent oxidoreductase